MHLNLWLWQSEDRRPSWDEVFMMHAQIAATRSTCDRGPEQKFREHRGTGAVIVSQDNRKVSMGYNGSPPGCAHCDDVDHLISNDHCVRTIHAEENAILNTSFELKHSRLYSTTVPCYDCCKRILAVGIVEVVFLHIYESRHFNPSEGIKLLEDHGVLVRQLTL